MKLGISKPAVRARIRRDTLTAEKTPDGVRVHVPPGATTDTTADATPSDVLAAKDETISLLKEQLAEEREARRRADVLLDRLTARIPALPPSQASDTAAQDAATVDEGYDTPTTQAADTRPWWRRLFGGGG